MLISLLIPSKGKTTKQSIQFKFKIRNTFRYPSSRSSTMRSYAMSSNYPETAIVHKDPEQPERSVASRSTINSLKGVENGGHGRHYSRTSSGFLQRFSNEGAPDPDLTSYRTIPNEDDDFGFRSRFSSTQVSKNQHLF